MLLHFAFVDLMLALCACMCPLFVAIGFGGHRRNCFVVIAGNEVRNPASIAFASVESAGENKDRE